MGMEKVFWLMWLADVVSSIGAVAALFGAVCLLGWAILCMFHSDIDEAGEVAQRCWRISRWGIGVIAFACLLPAKSTLYAAAAVQAADLASATPLGQKGAQAVNAILDKVIEEAGKKK